MTDTSRLIAPDEWLTGRNVRLRQIALSDCTRTYVDWLADPEVNRYLETRFIEQTPELVRAFVSRMIEDPASYLFAIIERSSGRHVGNIKIGPINRYHRYADVSYFIGERSVWGSGIATDAVCVATRFAFERLGLHRVEAGCYETNVSSQRVLLKAGYTLESRQAKRLRQTPDAPWEDHVRFCALADDWKPNSEA